MKQRGEGGFDGARTHDWQVSTDHESDALPTAPRMYFDYLNKANPSNCYNQNMFLIHLFEFYIQFYASVSWSPIYMKPFKTCLFAW